jgi:hypothetical protein
MACSFSAAVLCQHPVVLQLILLHAFAHVGVTAALLKDVILYVPSSLSMNVTIVTFYFIPENLLSPSRPLQSNQAVVSLLMPTPQGRRPLPIHQGGRA